MSIFTMQNVNDVMTMNHSEAMNYAMNIVALAGAVKPKTRAKAQAMIRTARTREKLAFAMSSWILAHPDEGLKVIN